MLLKELNLCLRDLEKIIDLGDPIAKFDYCCLAALKEASKNTTVSFKEALNKASPAEGFAVLQGHIFDLADLTFYKGVFYYYLGVYKEAL